MATDIYGGELGGSGASAAVAERAAETVATTAARETVKAEVKAEAPLLKRAWGWVQDNVTDKWGTKRAIKDGRKQLRAAQKGYLASGLDVSELTEAESNKMLNRVNDIRGKVVEKALAEDAEKMMRGGIVKRIGRFGKWSFLGALGLVGAGVIAANMRNQKAEIASSVPAIPPQEDLAMMQANLDAQAAIPPVAAAPEAAAATNWTSKLAAREQAAAAQPAARGV